MSVAAVSRCSSNRGVIMTNQLGKRYICVTCGISVLCTKSGNGEIECCDVKMELQEPRKLPSSD